MDLTFEGLGKLFLQFRKSKYFRPFYLIILAIITTGLFQFTAGPGALECLGILLIPTTVLIIPYWLGERSLKRFAFNALPVFVLALLLISAFQTQAVVSQGPVTLTTGYDPATPNNQLPKLSMWNGTVVPANGAPDQLYTFHVRLKEIVNGSVLATPNVTRISVNLTSYNPLPADTQIILPMQLDAAKNVNTSNGTWYIANRTLGDSVWQFYFWADDAKGNYTFAAAPVLLPVIAGAGTYYVFWMVNVVIYLLFPVSFYFIIVFMYWYTIRMRKMRERMMDRARAEKLDLDKGEGKGKPAEGGGTETPKEAGAKTKKAAAFTCTNCGADVTEDDAKCPKCGAVFED